ncbi:metallophosphoesterase family protein [Propionivibrio sp.]|uniref:metallophosphoesterase family protein n=1 Tax=Propionivibrio sp. TaxID=2212460 RepID=UPI0039E4298D
MLSDIHGNLAALEAVVKDMKRRSVDTVVNLGDSLSGPLLPRETAQFLMSQDWMHLAGNHERQLLTHGPGQRSASDEFAHSQLTSTEFAWLASLQKSVRHTHDILLCHGTPASDMEYFLETVEPGGLRMAGRMEIDARLGEERSAVVVCGHSHIPRSVRSSSGQLIVNPGSVGLPAYDDIHPFPHVVETGSPDARYAIIERTEGRWSCELISISYDHRSMEQLALARQRPDWARALSCGYMS